MLTMSCYNEICEKCRHSRTPQVSESNSEGVVRNSPVANMFSHRPTHPPPPPGLNARRVQKKRFRSAFTTSQVMALEVEFKNNPYVNTKRREQLANRLKLSERCIKIWFQNRRMKEKKDNSANTYDELNQDFDRDEREMTATQHNARQRGASCFNERHTSSLVTQQIEVKEVGNATINHRSENDLNYYRYIHLPMSDNCEDDQKDNRAIATKQHKELGNQLSITVTTGNSYASTSKAVTSREGVIKSTKDYFPTDNQRSHMSLNDSRSEGDISDESQRNEHIRREISRYYSAIASQNLPWNPYGFVPVLAPSYPPPYQLPATSIDSAIAPQPSTSTSNKCTCNRNVEPNPDAINVQPGPSGMCPPYMPPQNLGSPPNPDNTPEK